MRYIYKYTNLINNKKYVGQTNNINRRKREHLSASKNELNSQYNDPFHSSIRKYGIENFDFTVLEEIESDDQSFIDEREEFWVYVEYSYIIYGKGYNLTIGGQDSAYKSRLSEIEIEEIKDMIRNKTSYQIIKDKFHISFTHISNINHGYYFYKEKENYPLCNYGIEEEKILKLIELLEESKLTFLEISKLLNISESTVKKINYGKLRKGLVDNYPIRKITPQQKKANIIIDLLTNTKLSFKEIVKISNTSNETVRRINLGITNKKDEYIYPLRNIVETILS